MYIILIGFIYTTIKLISLILLILYYLVNKESENILNKEKYDTKEWAYNYCIRPKKLYIRPEHVPIGSMLYAIYWNKVFDLTYLKIILGRDKFWLKILKSIKFKEIFLNIFIIFSGVSRLMIKLIYETIKWKNKSLEDYLYEKSYNYLDDRLIIRINREWKVNGFIDNTLKSIEIILKNKNKMSTSNIELMLPRIYKILELYKKKIDGEIISLIFKRGIFLDKRTKIVHPHILNICKNVEKIGYITDYKKSEEKGDYSLNFLFKKVILEKESKVLEVNIEDVILNKNYQENKILPLLIAAQKEKYNEKLISEEVLENIKFFEDEIKNINLYLTDLNLDEQDITEIRNKIFEKSLEYYKINI